MALSIKSTWRKKSVRARIRVIGKVLRLSDAEVDAAMKTDAALISFANRHNQSLDWIVRGKAELMIDVMNSYSRQFDHSYRLARLAA